jgi:hypothetical protein
MLQRKKHQKYSNKAKVPQYTEKALVFMRDMIPSVSNILKIPQRGPFQITKINERNVTLLEPDTGQTIHTHIELIRPIDLKEFKLLLNKKWDLNVHHQKAIDKRTHPGLFDEPSNPIPLADIKIDDFPDEIPHHPPAEVIDEIELENLFYPPPTTILNKSPAGDEKNPPAPELINPPDGSELAKQTVSNDQQEVVDEFDQSESNTIHSLTSEFSQINSLHASRDLSKPFRDSLKSKKEKLITFFLSKHDQYIKVPRGETEVD